MPKTSARGTWIASDRFFARSVAQPIQRFLRIEAAGGLLLVAAALAALAWANSPWSAGYEALWSKELGIEVAGHVVSEDLRHWVNDGLMTLFFFVIGLEIKQELVSGQLASMRRAAVPAAGALGGMVVPALVYVAFNLGGDGAAGWGIPMATDVAFAVGVLALLGSRVPGELKVLLLGLAIVDDIGAIIVIAAFYSDGIAWSWLALAGGGLLAVAVLQRVRVRFLPVYVVVGVVVWFATFESGVHATIAGVALGLLTPARPFLSGVEAEAVADRLSQDADVTPAEVRSTSLAVRESVATTERLADQLHPWTSYLVVPLFALANAGVVLSGDSIREAAASRITIGVVLGLVVGKMLGVAGAITLAVRLGVGRLPEGITGRHILGMAGLAGIGFTVSIFVAGLAFADPVRADQAKMGVLAASFIAAILGTAILLAQTRRARSSR